MEKDVLLSVIISNLKEVEMMVDSFKGKELVIPAFVKVTLTKLDNIRQEIELFEQLNAISSQPVNMPDVVHTPAVPVVSEGAVAEITAEVPNVTVSASTPHRSEMLLEVVSEEPVAETKIIDAPSIHIEIDKPEIMAPTIPSVPVDDTPTVEPSAPKPIIEKPSYHQEPSVKSKHTSLGDTLGGDKTSLIDKMASGRDSAGSATQGARVDDIRKAIGINDRFLFSRELFGSNNSLMEQTILQINGFKTYDEAMQFLIANFNWQSSDSTVMAFMNVVKRRFI
ncbi:hypothetical protein LX69_00204 [Breznakibacter xylanolyticus]|uniref:Uncharacterized protein n=1 Tax=Breznakibacter xylanolyticus TaxID=990 RepID=A0A2W7QFR6_9BACT|nr:hypothetical protein [Breznakibacter xylanolyticus]MBN2742663.1 hypothetical protein [Marinilabiliaceae bacterium]PZX20779.1 hypothetical protein LX69_00204 [Breznakibacter xylanolyticus]